MSGHFRLLVLATMLVLSACSKDCDLTVPTEIGALEAVSGEGQKGWPGVALADDLVVKAVRGDGSAVGGVQVAWTVVSGGGELSHASSVTGPDGTSRVTWTLGGEQLDQLVLASVGTANLATFSAEVAVVGTWEPVANLPHAVRAPAAATDGQRVFVFGGTAGAAPRTAHTQIFDPSSGTWSTGADVPKAVDWSSAVYRSGLVHLMGGVTDETGATDEHWVYDVSADSWSPGVALPTPAAGSAAALVEGRIIVAGGIEAPGLPTGTVRIFNPASETWSEGTSAPVALYNWQGVAIDGGFFVAGGLDGMKVTSSETWRYDLGSSSWTSEESMPRRTEGYAAAEVSGLYCVIGGRIAPAVGSFSPPSRLVDCFAPEMNAWLGAPSLPAAVEEMGATSVDGTLYVIGGRISFSGVTGMVYRLVRPNQ